MERLKPGLYLVLPPTDQYTGGLDPQPICSQSFMQSVAPTKSRVWYKEPYVWMLIAFPLSSIIVCSILLTYSINTKDTLVRDNYYKDGMAMNQEFKWDNKARNMDIRVAFTVKDNIATLDILNSRLDMPSTLLLKFSHPTLQGKDRDSLLQLKPGSKAYQGFIDSVQDGKYYIQVECLEQSWRIRGEVYVINGETHSL